MTTEAVVAALTALQGEVQMMRIELADLREQSLHGPMDGLIGIKGVCELLDVSDRTLRRIRAVRGFPKPVKGKGRLRWRRGDIVRYLEGTK